MEAGKLRHRVEVQSPADATSSFGDTTQSWSTIATVWGEVKTLGGRELWRAQQTAPTATLRITIRYLQGLSSKMRFKLGSRVFNILHADNLDQRNITIETLCIEEPEPT